MDYNNLIFFIADLKDLPPEVLTDHIFEFQDTKIKYSTLGCTQENYDKYIVGARHFLISRDVAVKGSKWWAEIRAEKKDYIFNPETGYYDTKVYISLSEDSIASVVECMKTYAKLLIEDEIVLGTSGFNESLSSVFQNASSISELNILYEDFFGIEMPYHQAVELNRVTSNGQRIFNENRTKLSFIQ